MNFITYILLRLFVFTFSLIPMSVVHLLSNVVTFLLHKVIGYRKKVVYQNLKRSFPEKSEATIRLIEKDFYKNLSDILLESIKGLSISKTALEERFRYLNVDLIDEEYKKGKSAIILSGHIANWEWGVLSINFWTEAQVLGVYKPLSNPYINTYYNNKRTKWGLELTSMRQTGRTIIQKKNEPTIFVFIADQNPSDIKHAHWLEFLNQDTPFLHGADKIACKTKYAVFNTDIRRIKRGYYEVTFNKLCEAEQTMEEATVTSLFARDLEKIIQSRPADWLWSHKRWKHKRDV